MSSAQYNQIHDGVHNQGQQFVQSLIHADGDIHFGSQENSDAAKQCLRDLFLSDPRVDRYEILIRKGTLLKEACLWVRHDRSYRSWRDGDESQVLWIHGDPGKGKTMIMMALTDELSNQVKGSGSSEVLAYFFCQNTNRNANSATAVIRGLIYMLVGDHPHLLRHVQKKYDSAGAKLFEGQSALYSLWNILADMISDPSLKRAYICIDALDECVVDAISLLELITRTELWQASTVKWLITSRNEPWICNIFAAIEIQHHTSLEVNSDAVSQAVEAFVDMKTEVLAKEKMYDRELRAFVHDYLNQHVDGTFLWVALVCEELSKTRLRKTKEILQQFPAGLEPLYKRMMEIVESLPSEDSEYCKRILRAVTIATRPLALNELAFVAALPEDEFEEIEYLREAVHLCGSFLTLRNDVVFFVHQSAKDYFDTGKGAKLFNFEHAFAQKELVRRCLELMAQHLKQNMCELESPGSFVDDIDAPKIAGVITPNIRYACCYWAHHLTEAWKPPSDHVFRDEGGMLQTFFERYLLYWLESLSLLGEIFEGVAALLELDALLAAGTEGNNNLRATVSDAMRFVLAFRAAIEIAPLQLYSSALIFSPIKSIIRANYGWTVPGWIEKMPAVEDTWGSLLHTLEGHSNWVVSVSSSPDGKLLASGSDDETVKIWDTSSGALIHTHENHSPLNSVVFSSDGKRLAFGSWDARVEIWESSLRHVIHTLEGHSDSVKSVVFSSDGELLASGSSDETVMIWDTSLGILLQTLAGHSDEVNSVAFSPDKLLVASGSFDKTVRIWNVESGMLVRTLSDSWYNVNSAAFSPDGKLLACGATAYNQDKRTVLSIWDVPSGSLVRRLEGHPLQVISVVFSPDGKLMASSSWDSTVRIWDTWLGTPLHILEGHSNRVSSVVFSSNTLLASASHDHTVRIWDISASPSPYPLKCHLSEVTSIGFSIDGKLVASGSKDRTVKIWDALSRSLLHSLEGHSNEVTSVAFSADGLLVTAGRGEMYTWDVSSGLRVHMLEGQRFSSLVAFSPKANLVAGGIWFGSSTVNIWNTTSGALVTTLEGLSYGVTCMALSPDGKTLASGSGDSLEIWNVSLGARLRTLYNDFQIYQVAFSANGRMIAVRSDDDDSTVNIWNVYTGTYVQRFYDESFGASNLYDIIARRYPAWCQNSLSFIQDDHPVLVEQDSIETSTRSFQPASPYEVDKSGQWITCQGVNLLWLPASVRPGEYATHGKNIVLGTGSGRMTFLTLSYFRDQQSKRLGQSSH